MTAYGAGISTTVLQLDGVQNKYVVPIELTAQMPIFPPNVGWDSHGGDA